MAISRLSCRAAGAGSASTGRHVTGSAKLWRYWIQSQTTRSRARSTGLALSAVKTGPSAAATSTAPGPRSLVTGWTSICMVAPDPRAGQSRAGEDLRDAALEARRHHVDPADPRDLQDLLDDLRADRHSLIGHPAGEDAAQPVADLVRDPQAGNVAAHVLQSPQRADRPHPGQDLAARVQPQLPHLGHPARKRGDVEDELRLHELRAGR